MWFDNCCVHSSTGFTCVIVTHIKATSRVGTALTPLALPDVGRVFCFQAHRTQWLGLRVRCAEQGEVVASFQYADFQYALTFQALQIDVTSVPESTLRVEVMKQVLPYDQITL